MLTIAVKPESGRCCGKPVNAGGVLSVEDVHGGDGVVDVVLAVGSEALRDFFRRIVGGLVILTERQVDEEETERGLAG